MHIRIRVSNPDPYGFGFVKLGKDPDLQHYTQYGTVLKNKRGGPELKVRIRAEPTILLLQIGTPP